MGLPTHVHPRPPVTTASPAGLDERGERAFQAYLSDEEYEKAFAVGPGGAWGQSVQGRVRATAIQAALERCNDGKPRGCWLYAVGDTLLPRRLPLRLARLVW